MNRKENQIMLCSDRTIYLNWDRQQGAFASTASALLNVRMKLALRG